MVYKISSLHIPKLSFIQTPFQTPWTTYQFLNFHPSFPFFKPFPPVSPCSYPVFTKMMIILQGWSQTLPLCKVYLILLVIFNISFHGRFLATAVLNIYFTFYLFPFWILLSTSKSQMIDASSDSFHYSHSDLTNQAHSSS